MLPFLATRVFYFYTYFQGSVTSFSFYSDDLNKVTFHRPTERKEFFVVRHIRENEY